MQHQPQPQTLSFRSLINDIENGTTKIPRFQRDFVWSRDKTARLLDSILKGYPVGTFIIWRTREQLKSVREIGGLKLPPTPEGVAVNCVLDGQQRMTSIFAAIKGAVIERDGVKHNFRDLFVDLDAAIDSEIVVTDASLNPERYISFIDLYEGDLTKLSKYDKKFSIIQKYRDQLTSYQFSTIMISEVGMEVATEIFTRINTSGQPLTIFEIMVAKTYSERLGFDLAEAWKIFNEDLAEVGYGTVPAVTILQTVAAICSKECSSKAILALNRDRFISEWPVARSAIEHAVDYLRSALRIPVSELLPFNAVLVPLAYFFHKHPKVPSGAMAAMVGDLFWRISLGARYGSGAESRLAQDLRKVDSILDDRLPTYEWGIDDSSGFIEDNGYFSASRSYIKALLCILAYRQPKSYINNSQIIISNDWLRRANSKNYHHIFPKAFMKKVNEEGFYVNHIANISIVDDFLDKRDIGAKKPSQYFKFFSKKNKDLNIAMKSHLIDLDRDGIFEDDYDTFFDNRLKRFSAEIKKRLIPQTADQHGQAAIDDEIDDDDAHADAS